MKVSYSAKVRKMQKDKGEGAALFTLDIDIQKGSRRTLSGFIEGEDLKKMQEYFLELCNRKQKA